MDRQLRVERAPLSTLVADPANPRTHDARNLDAIADSLRAHGQVEPLLVQASTRMVIAGNGRAEAMRSLGWTHAQVVLLDVDDQQARALSIKLNRTAELAGWDEAVLQQHLRELDAWTDTGWDADLFGFTGDELEAMFDGLEPLPDPTTPSEPGAPPEPAAPEPVRLVAQFGAPPFTLLDSRRGYWQDRKRAWWATGLSSTAGREELVPSANTAEGKYEYFSGRGGANGAAGGSAFDPVLAELSYRWFIPADGHVLDPFAGESVKGVVAGVLGYDYTGVEVRPEQVEANRTQWRDVAAKLQIDHADHQLPGVPTPAVAGPGHTLEVLHGAAGPLVDVAVDLFAGCGGMPLREHWHQLPRGLQPVLAGLYDRVGSELSAELCDMDPIGEARDDGTVWVAYSGGKDGLAAALLLREQGYRPVLYHVQGVNRSYTRETAWAVRAAERLGLQLVVDRVRVRGPAGEFAENPFKNQVIVAMMVQRMLLHGGARYALGCHPDDDQDRSNPFVNWSDGIDAVRGFDGWLRSIVQGLHPVLYPLQNETHAVAVVAAHGCMDLVHGCLLPARHHARVRAANEAKHGPLLPGRCGSCSKCTREFVILQALGAAAPNTGRFRHCIAKLQKAMVDEYNADAGADPLQLYVDEATAEQYHRDEWPTEPTVAPPERTGAVKTPTWLHGDSAQLDAALPADAVYDGCVTSPPYYDLEVYSDNASDGSTLGTYPEFIAWYAGIWRQTVARLRDGAFVVVKVGDVRDEQGALRGFVHDNVQIFRDLGLSFYNDAVLATPAGTAPLRASLHFRAGRKLSKVHQHVLVFYKGDPRKIRQQIGELPDRYVAVPGVDT